MSDRVQVRDGEWIAPRSGALRHVSGLTLRVAERAGRKGMPAVFKVTPDRDTLELWQIYEIAGGTSFIALNKRIGQLQNEALAWCRWERDHVN